MIVDSHCHLDFDDLYSDLENVVVRSRGVGVGILQTISTKLSEIEKIAQIASRYPHIYHSIGVHPHEVEKEGVPTYEDLLKFSYYSKAIGIGETGLDYYYEHSQRAIQKESFVNHIRVARETGLPIIIHTRSAEDDTLSILREQMKIGIFSGLIHCFTASQEFAKECLDLGLYISVSGIITFKNATALREAIKSVPLERLLVETDSPYLAPVPMRGKANEPSFIVYTVDYLADLFGVTPKEISDTTTQNFLRLFSKIYF
jgi:TatD DNase family protein